MSERDGIYQQMVETHVAMAVCDRQIAKYPQYPSLGATRRSLEKRMAVLKSRLEKEETAQ